MKKKAGECIWVAVVKPSNPWKQPRFQVDKCTAGYASQLVSSDIYICILSYLTLPYLVLSMYLSVCLFVYPSIDPSIYLFVCLSVYLSNYSNLILSYLIHSYQNWDIPWLLIKHFLAWMQPQVICQYMCHLLPLMSVVVIHIYHLSSNLRDLWLKWITVLRPDLKHK